MLRKVSIISLFILVAVFGQSQNSFGQLPIIGKSFFALTVKNADSIARWYSTTFRLQSLKEINDTAMGVVVKIIGNDNMMIEILQMRDSKNAKDWGLKTNFQLHGFVKIGFFVKNLQEVQKYFDQNSIKIKHGPFTDEASKTKSLIISDCEGNLVQFFEDIK